MIIDLLGQSLEELYNKCSRKFSAKTMAMISDQLFERIETVHSQNYIHRDIKPDNFLIGVGKKNNILYIIDFGLSKKYRDSNTKQHIKFNSNRGLTGTARYASINSHLGYELSRKDDIEALAYLIIYLYEGELPWQGITCKNKQEKYGMILNVKLNTLPEQLCKHCPAEIISLLTYSKNLRFEDTPDYQYLRSLFSKIAEREHFTLDNIFDWNIEKKAHSAKRKKGKKKKSKSKNDEKIDEKNKIAEVKEDDNSTCIATSRWPEFQNREQIFAMIKQDKAAKELLIKETAKEPSRCLLF